MSMNLGAMFMSQSATYEPQRSFNFIVQFTGLGTNGSTIMLSTQSFPLPTESSSVQTVNNGNTQVKYAGQVTWSSGSLVLRDYIDLDTELAIVNWRQQVYNPRNDAVGWAVNYKKEGIITEVAPDGAYGRTWIMEGCWPSDADFGNLDSTSDSIKTLTLTIQYDKAFRDGTNTTPGQVSQTPAVSSNSAYQAKPSAGNTSKY